MTLYVGLTVVGGALEITGFVLVAVELFRTQRREFGTPKAVASVLRLKGRFERRVGSLLRRIRFWHRTATPEESETSPAYITGMSAGERAAAAWS
jgi:hypothetical protein